MRFDDFLACLKNELNPDDANSIALKKAYCNLSERYKQSTTSGFSSKLEMVAYVEARFPATFAVVDTILSTEITENESIHSVLDLGAGPGTATLATFRHFPIEKSTIIEQTPDFVSAMQVAFEKIMPNVDFDIRCDSIFHKKFIRADLVILSYVLTEMQEAEALAVYQDSLAATNTYNLVVLPGTRDAFLLLLKLREQALRSGFSILAPCPHACRCPMADIDGQWCHFYQRLTRNSTHQQIKMGTLGYEDEPYCYLLVSPVKLNEGDNRIIRDPRRRSGHYYVDVCRSSGNIETMCVTKKDPEKYKLLKNAKSGKRI